MNKIEFSINNQYGAPALRLHNLYRPITSLIVSSKEMIARITFSTVEWETTTTLMVTPKDVAEWLRRLEDFNLYREPECILFDANKRLSLHLEEEEGVVVAVGSFSSKDYLADMEFQFETSQAEIRKTIQQAYDAVARLDELEGGLKDIGFN